MAGLHDRWILEISNETYPVQTTWWPSSCSREVWSTIVVSRVPALDYTGEITGLKSR